MIKFFCFSFVSTLVLTSYVAASLAEPEDSYLHFKFKKSYKGVKRDPSVDLLLAREADAVTLVSSPKKSKTNSEEDDSLAPLAMPNPPKDVKPVKAKKSVTWGPALGLRLFRNPIVAKDGRAFDYGKYPLLTGKHQLDISKRDDVESISDKIIILSESQRAQIERESFFKLHERYPNQAAGAEERRLNLIESLVTRSENQKNKADLKLLMLEEDESNEHSYWEDYAEYYQSEAEQLRGLADKNIDSDTNWLHAGNSYFKSARALLAQSGCMVNDGHENSIAEHPQLLAKYIELLDSSMGIHLHSVTMCSNKIHRAARGFYRSATSVLQVMISNPNWKSDLIETMRKLELMNDMLESTIEDVLDNDSHAKDECPYCQDTLHTQQVVNVLAEKILHELKYTTKK